MQYTTIQSAQSAETTRQAPSNDIVTHEFPKGVLENVSIRTPHPHDVLCGRGGGINSHDGNKRYREWVISQKETYNLAESKQEKANISRQIITRVRSLNPPGRFLTKERKVPGVAGFCWAEIDENKAMSKTSQALREGAPEIRAAHGQSHPHLVNFRGGNRKRNTTRCITSVLVEKNKKVKVQKISSRAIRESFENTENSCYNAQPTSVQSNNSDRILGPLYTTAHEEFEKSSHAVIPMNLYSKSSDHILSSRSSMPEVDSMPQSHISQHLNSTSTGTQKSVNFDIAIVEPDAKICDFSDDTPPLTPAFSPTVAPTVFSSLPPPMLLDDSIVERLKQSSFEAKKSKQREHSLFSCDWGLTNEVLSKDAFTNPFQDEDPKLAGSSIPILHSNFQPSNIESSVYPKAAAILARGKNVIPCARNLSDGIFTI
mmetsp:Transcript_59670/g.69732  ORF Transcript_59670/g.69732 Transcript_59670/m.69732 type:complete len:429 (-) Transcript_59670:128-1414(-)|eukprot:CAMPEP_0194363154 /NCGR_PEP_ID=MMETSP0174-20130528/11047_1 /TAXON_ID=216777 /ORGANISM="Proboscia alata, Strain PI-D3" /LENGTH=428 /DNA_ID=CAMNT_0039136497 /DNA_START=256 /DNA_END=1542 /DNA_ORIENTATION=-